MIAVEVLELLTGVWFAIVSDALSLRPTTYLMHMARTSNMVIVR